MSFKPANSRIFSPSAKSGSRSSSSKFRSSPYDRLGTIVAYGETKDSAGHTFPTIIMEEDGSHKLYEARINADSSARGQVTRAANQTRSGNFQGNIIDGLMQEKMPVGDRVVLESTVFLPRAKSVVNGQEKLAVECSYITHVTEPSPTKTFRTVVTAKADFRGSHAGAGSDSSGSSDGLVRVRDYDVWGTYQQKPASTSGAPASESSALRAFSSKDELRQLAADLDASNQAFQAGNMLPSLGVAFRAIVRVGSVPADLTADAGRTSDASAASPRPALPADDVYVVNESPRFDWVSAVKDPNDDQKIITEGHPLDGEEFRNLYSQYADYIFGNPDSDPATPAQEFIAKLPEDAEVKIEVIAYHRYLASSFSKFNQMSSNPYHPLRRLCFTSSKYGQEDTYYHQGHNVAVAGIVMLAGDKFDKTAGNGSGAIVPRNIVTRVFFNAPTGNLHAFIRTSDGKKAHLHPSLDDPNRFAARAKAAAQFTAGQATASPPATGSFGSSAPASMDNGNTHAHDNSPDAGPEMDHPEMDQEPAPMDSNGDFFAQLLNAHSDGAPAGTPADLASASLGDDPDDVPFGDAPAPTPAPVQSPTAPAPAPAPTPVATAPAKKPAPAHRGRRAHDF